MFTLNDALKSLEGRPEFAVKRYDGLVCINYLLQLPDSFEGIRANFRGITFDEVTGECISLPFHKFYNINQLPTTQWNLLSSLTGTIYEKVDGSMVHFFMHRGNLRCATRMSAETPQALEALKFFQKTSMLDAVVAEVEAGYTPLFEYISPNNQIVVEYPETRLVYLNSRNRKTGEYRFNESFEDRAQRYHFPFSQVLDNLDKEEFEGYVCHLENGLWVKCKGNWYMERHRAVDALMRPAYRLYEVVFAGVMDDLIAVAPDRHKPRLLKIYADAQMDLLREKKRVEELFQTVRALMYEKGYTQKKEWNFSDRDDKVLRKAFALHVQQHHAGDMSLLMTLYCGGNPEEEICRRLMEGYKLKYPNRIFQDPDE